MNFTKRNDCFVWNGIKIRQHEHVLKVGTDSILLGSWIPLLIKDPPLILDVGTGTGILALMMCYAFPYSNVEAIDINQHATRLAHNNFSKSSFSSRLKVQCEDIFDPSIPATRKYDVVLSNPPYHISSTNDQRGQLSLAKHLSMPPGEWLRALHARMKVDGHLFLILPFEVAGAWIRNANELKLYSNYRMNVYSFESDVSPKRCLLHFSEELKEPVFSRLTIYSTSREYTQEFLQFSCIQPTSRIKEIG